MPRYTVKLCYWREMCSAQIRLEFDFLTEDDKPLGEIYDMVRPHLYASRDDQRGGISMNHLDVLIEKSEMGLEWWEYVSEGDWTHEGARYDVFCTYEKLYEFIKRNFKFFAED